VSRRGYSASENGRKRCYRKPRNGKSCDGNLRRIRRDARKRKLRFVPSIETKYEY